MKESLFKQCRKQWDEVCKLYVAALCEMWELNVHLGYWIGNEVGGVWDYSDGCIIINMDDIRYAVDNGLNKQAFFDWQEYSLSAASYEFYVPTLKEWCEDKVKKVPKGTFERLDRMKADLDRLVEEEKEKLK